MTKVKVGDIAPPFEAAGTGDKTYSLEDYRGQSVVLVFYPGDATPVCTAQLKGYSESFEQFSHLDATMLALSPQNVESHEVFHAEHGFAFPLLFDEDKKIGSEYGVVGPLGFYRRSLFVIDPDGVIQYANRSAAGMMYPKTDRIVKALEEWKTE